MEHEHRFLDAQTTKVIACATVIEEMLPLMPPEIECQRMEFGLHTDPDKLRQALQQAIDQSDPQRTTILLGYGLCSRAVAGLKSDTRRLIVPKVDDCISVFLGSSKEYQEQQRAQPGTLYKTKGWLEADKSSNGLPDMVKRYGEARAKAIFKQMMKNYTRMVFINTGNYAIEHFREISRIRAAEMDLKYEEIQGSNRLIKKLLSGPWDEEFVVAEPGRALTFLDFRS